MPKTYERIISPWGPIEEEPNEDKPDIPDKNLEVVIPFGFPIMDPPEARRGSKNEEKELIGFTQMRGKRRVKTEERPKPESQGTVRHNPFE